MSSDQLAATRTALMRDMRAHRFCAIANCGCDTAKEWKKRCHCLCHFFTMDLAVGKDTWDLTDFGASAKAGRPMLAPKAKRKRRAKP